MEFMWVWGVEKTKPASGLYFRWHLEKLQLILQDYFEEQDSHKAQITLLIS